MSTFAGLPLIVTPGVADDMNKALIAALPYRVVLGEVEVSGSLGNGVRLSGKAHAVWYPAAGEPMRDE